MTSSRLKVGLLPYKYIGWLCIAFFSFASVMSWHDGQRSVSPLFGIFIALGVYMLLAVSSLELDSTSIVVNAPFARYAMPWSDVERVETSKQGTLVFYGVGRKRLVFVAPTYWSGTDKREMVGFMKTELERRNLKPTVNVWAEYLTQKNVRVTDTKSQD